LSAEVCFPRRLMCESPESRPRLCRGRCAGDKVGGSPVRLSVGLGGLFGVDLVEGDGVAERFELSLESASAVFDGVALALPVGSEVSVWDLVADDVEVGHEQVVAVAPIALGSPRRPRSCAKWAAR
jgi:hypothetical protein